MRNSSAAAGFIIHEDDPLLTGSAKLGMDAERTTSNQTIVHHASRSEDNCSREGSVDNEHDETATRERHINRIEAKIQAAARAVVESIEDDYRGDEDSVLSVQTDECYEPEGTELTYRDGTELTYGDDTEATYEIDGDEHHNFKHGQQEPENDSSSHHDGDIDDDVFSPNSGRSARSSLNSCEEPYHLDRAQKNPKSPSIGEPTAHHDDDTMSRIPSTASYMRSPPDDTIETPSKRFSRPPFRTPSSVRALQMSSPAPSIFSSPRSSKRHGPNVSRMSTPTSPSKNKTPTRFKFKTEKPLILLHVTVLPLRWPYSHIISSPHLPSGLQSIKQNWHFLQDKLNDTVLERGILLPHPQDSYEMLIERLLEALELPMRPRARILRCGHYLGPSDISTSDDESDAPSAREIRSRASCETCRQEYSYEEYGPEAARKRFRVKFFAGNGLMTAGAWAAAWREMERVDVEIEPVVGPELVSELEHLIMIHKAVPEMDDHFVSEDEEAMIEEDGVDTAATNEHRTMEDEIMEDEAAKTRKEREEERMREIYGVHIPSAEPRRPRSSQEHRPTTASTRDSLPELLLAAFKVAMRDQKNIAICLLSFFVILLALKPGSGAETYVLPDVPGVISMPEVVTQFVTQTISVMNSLPTAKTVSQVAGILEDFPKAEVERPEAAMEPDVQDSPTMEAAANPTLEVSAIRSDEANVIEGLKEPDVNEI